MKINIITHQCLPTSLLIKVTLVHIQTLEKWVVGMFGGKPSLDGRVWFWKTLMS